MLILKRIELNRRKSAIAIPKSLDEFDYRHQTTVPVGSAEIDRTIDEFMDDLQNPNLPDAYRKNANKVYRWLVEPIQQLLNESEVSTLFFIPDGSLRRIPLAALWDGKKHLIEKYAIASAPGLTLLNAEPFSSVERTTLLAGISNPYSTPC